VTFEVARTIQYWINSAAYDLETGKALLVSKRFPYALFFGHLAIEKVLKAIVVKATQAHAPFTHSLPLLASKTNIEIPESIIDRLAEYTEFHMEWNQDIQTIRRTSTKNAPTNLPGKNWGRWRESING